MSITEELIHFAEDVFVVVYIDEALRLAPRNVRETIVPENDHLFLLAVAPTKYNAFIKWSPIVRNWLTFQTGNKIHVCNLREQISYFEISYAILSGIEMWKWKNFLLNTKRIDWNSPHYSSTKIIFCFK